VENKTMPKCNPIKTFAIAIAAALLAGHAQAAIITPSAATSTSTIGGSRTIVEVINGSDLSAGGASGDILSETHDPLSDKAGYWLSANGAGNAPITEILTFDLGGTFNVDAVHLWNYDRGGDNPTRAIKTFDISFSTNNGVSYDTTVTGATLGDFVGANNPRVNGEIAVQTKTFAVQSDVTNIKIDNIVIQGPNAYIGFAEIRFGATEIPEPASLASGLLGLTLIAGRRRR
jgi:hypothetical protein